MRLLLLLLLFLFLLLFLLLLLLLLLLWLFGELLGLAVARVVVLVVGVVAGRQVLQPLPRPYSRGAPPVPRLGGGGGGEVVVEDAVRGVGGVAVVAVAAPALPAGRQEELPGVVVVVPHVRLAAEEGALLGGGEGGGVEEGWTGTLHRGVFLELPPGVATVLGVGAAHWPCSTSTQHVSHGIMR